MNLFSLGYKHFYFHNNRGSISYWSVTRESPGFYLFILYSGKYLPVMISHFSETKAFFSIAFSHFKIGFTENGIANCLKRDFKCDFGVTILGLLPTVRIQLSKSMRHTRVGAPFLFPIHFLMISKFTWLLSLRLFSGSHTRVCFLGVIPDKTPLGQ